MTLKEAVRFQSGHDSLDGMSAAVQGLGAVGYATSKYLASEKTKLYISSTDKDKFNRFKSEYQTMR